MSLLTERNQVFCSLALYPLFWMYTVQITLQKLLSDWFHLVSNLDMSDIRVSLFPHPTHKTLYERA